MRAYITLSFFIIIAAASYWLLDDITEESNDTEKADARFPNYFLENFSMTSINLQGLPQYTLRAKKMLHFSDDDSAELEHPILNMLQGNTKIQLSASQGTFLKKENLVYLRDNVVIHRAPSENQSELYIYTDYLKINTQSQIAETHLPAKIKSQDSEINTTGLIFNKQQGTLKLHSNVKGVYEAVQ